MSDSPPPPPPPGEFPPPPPPSGGFGAPPPPTPAGYTPYAGGPPAGSGLTGAPLAGFGTRLGGWIIDYLIMGAFFIPSWIALVSGPKEITECSVNSSGDLNFGGEVNALCEGPTGGTIAMAAVLGIAAIVAALVYQAKLAGGPNGQTVGMKVVGVRVIDATTGAPIGGGKAVGRFLFASFISGLFCYLGYLWNLWDPKKQTWQDKVTSAIVIKT